MLILSTLLCCSSKDEAVSNKRCKWHFCKSDFELGARALRPSQVQTQLSPSVHQMETKKNSRCWPAIWKLLEPVVFTTCGIRCLYLGFVSTTEETVGLPGLSRYRSLRAVVGTILGYTAVLIFAVFIGSLMINMFSHSVMWKNFAGLSQNL